MARTPEAKVKISVFNQDFNKEMKQMGQEAGKLRQEFKLQEEQMRNSASETEKLQAKMQYLTKQQELAAKRVQDTQKQYAAVASQYGESSQAAQEMYRRLQNARIEEQKLANQLQDTNQALQDQKKHLESAADSAGEFGEKMSNAGQGLTAAVTLPILGIGAAAAKAADDLDSAFGRISATTDRTVSDTKELQEAAQELWRDAYGEDITDVVDAISLVDRNLGNLVESTADVKDLAENAFILRDAFGYDIQESTRAAAALMSNFGITGQEAMDMITTAAQRGGDYSGELLDSISEYSTQFANMGYSASSMMGMFVEGAENGIFSLDKLADTVKESFLQITDGGKGTKDAIKELGLDYGQVTSDIQAGGEKANAAFGVVMTAIAGVRDEADRNRLAIELMGTPLEDLGPQYQAFFADTSRELQNFRGSTAQAGDELYDNFGTRMTKTFRTVQEALLPVGETILGIVESALPAIEKMSSAFANLSPVVQKVIMVIGAVAAVIGPLLIVAGMVANAIQGIVLWLAPLIAGITEAGGLIAFLSTKFTALFAAITGPIGIVIMAVTALIAVFVALYKNNEEFRIKVNEIWAGIKAAFQTALTFIQGIVQNVMTAVTSFFSSQLAVIRQFWDQNGKQIMNLVKSYFGLISSYIQMVMGVIKGIFQTIWPVIAGVVKIAWGLIQGTIKNALTIILGAIQFFLRVFKGDWSGAFNSVKDTVSKIMSNIVSTFKGINLLQIGKDIINGLVNGIGSMTGAVKRMVSKLASNIPGWAKDILGIRSPSRVMIEVGEDTGEGAVVGLENKLAKVRKVAAEFAQTVIPDYAKTATGAGATAAAGATFDKGLLNSLQSAFGQQLRLPSTITVISQLDGHEVARNQYPFIDEMMAFNARRAAAFRGDRF